MQPNDGKQTIPISMDENPFVAGISISIDTGELDGDHNSISNYQQYTTASRRDQTIS